MSETDASYQEIDLDNLPANPQLVNPSDDFEIVDENVAAPEQQAEEPQPPPTRQQRLRTMQMMALKRSKVNARD